MTTTMIDSIHATCHNIPVGTRKVAGYVTGSSEIRWTRADWDRFDPRHTGLVRIDQSFGAMNAFPRTVISGVSRARRSETFVLAGLVGLIGELWFCPGSKVELKISRKLARTLFMDQMFLLVRVMTQGLS